ncbi:NAD-dependent epimerase/dehydratase family protein [Flavobacterium gawalongense]|uniref:NAD-dependent epimerase/dehydratase family protein n=1 Tax=Flavobacterium gawalongense TaxID=2594432 RepID=A0ABY3CJN0_9FLAO|nr:NAD-dependent epimerase/dehydratase family protein [Flavobacterium gawalongense]TRX01229.1 NAD-dependent epimerase/dehydratase family protein [Flavobacterium gawalongense]TRX05246.1 NAD-dependent epimerase/dehydratase family protein [Flavobacterium gawalongense]TRX09149.1 NAD-dependent epimerase/dehydratase family protein [Flavobacterium gawalongense]TRX26673.1 NAD-dependent epimerase/dehydratase family protein [Flavobacterium gawalongense]
MILVTGGTGLVGAHVLLHLIESGENVRAIYRDTKSIEKTKNLFNLYKKPGLFATIEWIQADIIDIPALEKAFDGIDYVYHCAALISFDPKDEDLVRKTNIEGTANIVNFCIANTIKKLCFVSSIAALGDIAPHENYITEETEWNPEKPHSDYAISKYGAEMEIWRGQQEGLNVIIVNPGVIIGPGFWEQGSGQLFMKVKKGLSFYTLGSTGFVAVTDVVRIATQLMKSEIRNERFTLIAQNMVFRDVLNTIADALKVKKPTIHAKPFLIEFGWRMDWLMSTIFQQKRELTEATAKASYSRKEYSNEKIKTFLKTDFLDIHQYIKEISAL